MQEKFEKSVTTLVTPQEYKHHLNEVLGVTTERIFFLKRKFFSGAGSEMLEYSLDDCSSIIVMDEKPLIKVILGTLLVFLMLFIFYCIYIYWSDFEPGTRIYIGMFGLALFYGFTWMLGARRHRIVFTLCDGTKLTWKSSSGDFNIKSENVARVVELAKSKGLYNDIKNI
ncbi:MAG: hypothetical protein V4708_18345 [Bacteroidota bacterium]